MAKVSYFNDPYSFMTAPNNYDIYIMDMDSKEDVIKLTDQAMKIEEGRYFIFISSSREEAYRVMEIRGDYFLTKPIIKSQLLEKLAMIKKKIQADSIMIPVPGGERRVRANNLNYINIVKRCLCYHLKDGTMFDGQTLRGSFEKAIAPLHINNAKSFLFLAPSLLINIGEIKILNSDNLVFENDDVLYFPKKSYDIIREAWINYNKFINL